MDPQRLRLIGNGRLRTADQGRTHPPLGDGRSELCGRGFCGEEISSRKTPVPSRIRSLAQEGKASREGQDSSSLPAEHPGHPRRIGKVTAFGQWPRVCPFGFLSSSQGRLHFLQ